MVLNGEIADSIELTYKLFPGVLEKNANLYYLSYGDKPLIMFKSYSYKYFIEDLERMLFIEKEYPWIDVKYKKRLNRLLFLYFVELFTHPASLYFRDKLIGNLGRNVLVPIYQNLSIRKRNEGMHKALLLPQVNMLKTNQLGLWRVLSAIITLYPKSEEYRLLYLDFIQTIIENFDIFEQVIAATREMYNKDMTIKEKDLYTGDIHESLI